MQYETKQTALRRDHELLKIAKPSMGQRPVNSVDSKLEVGFNHPKAISRTVGLTMTNSLAGADSVDAAEIPRKSAWAFLQNPLFDRVVALIACSPYIHSIYKQFEHGIPQLTTLVLMSQMLLFIGMMSIRRGPVRVTANPWFWVLAFVASYLPYFVAKVTSSGEALVPGWVTSGLSLFSAAISVYGRVSLGRSHGLVPAQRKLMMGGAYRHVRHPLYCALFIGCLAAILHDYSPANLAVTGFAVLLFMIKSIVEERFLAGDPEYREYMREVPWRWIPHVI